MSHSGKPPELPLLESRNVPRTRTFDVAPGSLPPSRSGKNQPPHDAHLKVAHLEEQQVQQERMNSYFMELFNKVESRLQSALSRGVGTFEEKRLELLEQDMKRHEMEYRRLEEHLKGVHTGYRGVDSRLKGLQRQEDSELTQLRGLLQGKLSDDHKIQLQNKEKSQVLFGEVVRLGETNEKNQEFLQNLSITVEQRLATLEHRLNHGESSVATLSTKSDGGVNMLIELAERVEKRMHMIENALSALNSDQQNDHKSIDNIGIGTSRLQDEVKNFLKQLQGDIQHRLELRTSEALNRLLQEQEERLRNDQDLKYTFEVKDKMVNEKLNFSRDEFRERVASLENHFRTELQRKEDSLNNLRTALDAHVTEIYDAVKQGEVARAHAHNETHDYIAQVLSDTRDAIEGHKTYQDTITGKMTEMVKAEIESRLKGEKGTKNLIQSTTKGLMQEISMLKENMDRNRMRSEFEVKEVQNAFSEKADLLSRYLEEEIRRTTETMRTQHDQTKGMIATLTESLKHTIISNEKWKTEANNKFAKVDRALTHIKSELAKVDNVHEARILYKMKELQASLHSSMAGNAQVLEDRVAALAAMVDSSLGLFEKDIVYNREVFADILNQLNRDITEQHRTVCEDLGKLLGGFESLQLEIDSIGEETQDKVLNLEKQLGLGEAHTAVQLSTEKMLREHLLTRITANIQTQLSETEGRVTHLQEQLAEAAALQRGTAQEAQRQLEDFTQTMGAFKQEFKEHSEGQEASDKALQSQLALNEGASRAEIQDLLSRITEIGEKAAEQGHSGQQLGEMQQQLREESKEHIQEVFARKVAKLQEDLQKNNQDIWEEVVKTVAAHQGSGTNLLSSLSDKIHQIAANTAGDFMPQIRFS